MQWARPNCPHCGRRLHSMPSGFARCRRRQCPGYSKLWAGDQRRKMFVNLGQYAEHQPVDVKEATVALVTVTAPGVAGGLPWDERHCAALGEHQHSGLVGCRVAVLPGGEWNREAPGSWRQLNQRAYQRCRRDGLAPWLLLRTWEMQHRGALHAHAVLAYSTAAEKSASNAYVSHLRERSRDFRFGSIDVVTMPARAAAAYLSSYFVTGKRGKEQLHDSVVHPGMPRSIVHVSTRLSMATGCTMRRLRMKRYCHVRGFRPMCVGDTYHVFDRYCIGEHGPARAQERADAAP